MVRSPKSAPARRAAVRPGRGSLLTAGAALATVVGALVVLPVTNASAATVLYVATTGKDTNAGSSAAPLKTVQAAVDKLPAIGGTILLKSGTYTGRVVLKDRAGIAIKEDVGATAVISGVGLDAPAGRSALIEIRNSSGIAVQGLDITGYRSASQDDQPMGILVIGGSTGLDEAVMARADHRWSLGPLTLPHELARVVVLEQWYRAWTILHGERYHK